MMRSDLLAASSAEINRGPKKPPRDLRPPCNPLGRYVRAFGAVVLVVSLAWAQSAPAGHWQGSFGWNNLVTQVTLDLDKNERSEWIASMGLPAESLTGLVVMNLAVDGNSVKFVAAELRMAEFNLTLGRDGRMKGAISVGQDLFPIELKRTGAAKVKLPIIPAVSKDLEGDWEGLLDLGGRTIRVTVNLKNRPDKTVAGTFQGVPITDVIESGRAVSLRVRPAHANFKGTRNVEGTELSGQLNQDGMSRPLTLRRR